MLCERTNKDVNINVVSTIARMATRFLVLFDLKLRLVRVRMMDFCFFMVSPPSLCDFSIFNTDGAVSLFRNLRVMGYHYDGLMEFLAGDF